jgi:hypothetical protein
VGPRGEHFDALEAMRCDLDQVLTVEASVVKQVRGHAKARAAHRQLLGKWAKFLS